jgi:large subunit ribosomal protein L1
MAKTTKYQKKIAASYNLTKVYPLSEAIDLAKQTHGAKFDAAVDIAVNLGVNPQKADQMVRGTVTLPHGTGKVPRVLVICSEDKEKEAKAAHADHVGNEVYLKKLEGGWADIDVIVTMPALMAKLGRLGKVIGPKGLMPNPKSGTVTTDIGKAVQDIKSGKISFRVEKSGIIHMSVGRASFEKEKLQENIEEVMHVITRLKPVSLKGTYFKKIAISTTMGPGIQVDSQSINTK